MHGAESDERLVGGFGDDEVIVREGSRAAGRGQIELGPVKDQHPLFALVHGHALDLHGVHTELVTPLRIHCGTGQKRKVEFEIVKRIHGHGTHERGRIVSDLASGTDERDVAVLGDGQRHLHAVGDDRLVRSRRPARWR